MILLLTTGNLGMVAPTLPDHKGPAAFVRRGQQTWRGAMKNAKHGDGPYEKRLYAIPKNRCRRSGVAWFHRF